jgi:hypothetical protein
MVRTKVFKKYTYIQRLCIRFILGSGHLVGSEV